MALATAAQKHSIYSLGFKSGNERVTHRLATNHVGMYGFIMKCVTSVIIIIRAWITKVKLTVEQANDWGKKGSMLSCAYITLINIFWGWNVWESSWAFPESCTASESWSGHLSNGGWQEDKNAHHYSRHRALTQMYDNCAETHLGGGKDAIRIFVGLS